MNAHTHPHSGSRWASATAQRDAEAAGLAPVPGEWRSALLDILDAAEGTPSAARFIGCGYAGRELYAVTLCGRIVRAVYSPEAALIVALLPDQRVAVPAVRRPRPGFLGPVAEVERHV